MQNGSNPKGKYLIIILQTIKWWEISCDSFLAETLMSVVGRGKTEEVMAGWQPVFISWLLVAHQWPEVWGSTSNPYITGVISTITARLTAARPLHWMYIIAHKHQPRRNTHWEKKKDTLQTHMHMQMHTCAPATHTQICWIGNDLSDLAGSTCVPLLNAPVSSLPSSKLSFAILSKASLMPPITGGLQAGRFGARRLGRRVCYASGPFNRVVICCCWCWSCLCRLINGKLPSLWWSARSPKPKLWGETQKYQAFKQRGTGSFSRSMWRNFCISARQAQMEIKDLSAIFFM